MIERDEIDEQLLRYLLKESTPEERRAVEEWVERDEKNAAYFKRFQRLHLWIEWGMRAEMVKTSFEELRRWLTRRRRFV